MAALVTGEGAIDLLIKIGGIVFTLKDGTPEVISANVNDKEDSSTAGLLR